MDREDFWWLLWGILFAFTLQVIYDGIGEYPNLPRKELGGYLIIIVFAVILILIGPRMIKKKENK
jgi:hypothetical protein